MTYQNLLGNMVVINETYVIKEVFMFSKKVKKGYVLYQNENGPEIGTSKDRVIIQDGHMKTGDWDMKNGQKTWLPDFRWR